MTANSQPNNLDAIVFVYRNEAGVIRCEYVDRAMALQGAPEWTLIESLEPRRWIEAHWCDVQIAGGTK